MPRRPGGLLSGRPLHFYWICDCSASMGLDGKIQALNTAVREVLPLMRDVAAENPSARVLMRTLRFSSGARWIEPEPVPLEQFQWTDLQADDLPRTAEFAAEFRQRLDREGAKSGDVQLSLMWNNYNDLDLHCVCPCGEEIYFGDKKSSCGGELDVDMNVSPTSKEPVENIFWPPGGAPEGRYRVYVNHYKNHGQAGCADPTPFKVAIAVGGGVEEFNGSISYGQQKKLVHEFDLGPGSFAGKGAGNTDTGEALENLAQMLRIPPMSERALPPVLVLVSDGVATDDYGAGLRALLQQPWGKKAVRIAIAIGDADDEELQHFVAHPELRPVRANNPEALVRYIKWASTAVLKSASSPPSQMTEGGATAGNVPVPRPPTEEVDQISVNDVW